MFLINVEVEPHKHAQVALRGRRCCPVPCTVARASETSLGAVHRALSQTLFRGKLKENSQRKVLKSAAPCVLLSFVVHQATLNLWATRKRRGQQSWPKTAIKQSFSLLLNQCLGSKGQGLKSTFNSRTDLSTVMIITLTSWTVLVRSTRFTCEPPHVPYQCTRGHTLRSHSEQGRGLSAGRVRVTLCSGPIPGSQSRAGRKAEYTGTPEGRVQHYREQAWHGWDGPD